MPRPLFADLHSHTTASDGELSPQALVDLAAAAGLQAFAVTDHDSIGSVVAAAEHGRKVGVEVIPGTELTVYEGELELHMLALFFSLDAKPLLDLLELVRQHRRERALKMAAQLRAAGYAIDDQDILTAAANAESIGRPHVGAALVKRGHAGNMNAAMSNFLARGKVGYVPKLRLPPAQAIDAVHASGGVAILAHPGIEPHDELIPPLFRLGLDGVEAEYFSHSPINRRFYTGLARRYEKVISGGSDYHGPRLRPNVTVGAAGLDRAEFGALRKAAARWQRGVPGFAHQG